MITEHSVPSFSAYLNFFFPVFPIAFHLLPQRLLLGNTLKIRIGPFVPTLVFGESVGWWVSITTLPIILSSRDGQSDEARQVSQVTGPEATKARAFGFQDIWKILCTSHWPSFLHWLDLFFLLQCSSHFFAPFPLTTPHLSYLPLIPFSLFSSSLVHIQDLATTIAVNLQSLT